ncbi:hypothetical protein Scep_004100 [Stephania cephalantha]|uniref:Uncharacterized protein n=1 Tax=Stephania cephalantha TaxID=152367 RepID=A0AAP0PYQ5_9MAGN
MRNTTPHLPLSATMAQLMMMMGALMPKTNSSFFVKPNLTCKPSQRKSTILSFSVRASPDNIEIPRSSDHGKNSGSPGQTHNYGNVKIITEKILTVDEVKISRSSGEDNSVFQVAEEELAVLAFEAAVITDPESSSADEEKNEGKENRETDDDSETQDDIVNLEN